ncbi:MAG TPA: hypothetical protein V6D29_13410 [Leptolyngbyaceae cyanobacterium]
MALRDLVESVLADFQPFFEQHRAIVQVNLPSDLPLVDIDLLQVRQVYENLISNALNYTRQASPSSWGLSSSNSRLPREVRIRAPGAALHGTQQRGRNDTRAGRDILVYAAQDSD